MKSKNASFEEVNKAKFTESMCLKKLKNMYERTDKAVWRSQFRCYLNVIQCAKIEEEINKLN